jgi:hypothetical protein
MLKLRLYETLLYFSNNPNHMKNITIAVIDPWKFFREGIAKESAEASFETIIKACDENELFTILDQGKILPEICVFNANILVRDLTIPERLKQKWSKIKVVAYAPNDKMHDESIFRNIGLDMYLNQNESLKPALIKLRDTKLLLNSY